MSLSDGDYTTLSTPEIVELIDELCETISELSEELQIRVMQSEGGR